MVSLEEQETVIQFNRANQHATIYTSDSTMMTKLDKLCISSPANYKLVKVETQDGKIVGKFYSLADKKMVSLRREKVKRELTDEQREELRQRALNNLQKKSVFLNTGIATEILNEVDV